jgi:hypothetical protein
MLGALTVYSPRLRPVPRGTDITHDINNLIARLFEVSFTIKIY